MWLNMLFVIHIHEIQTLVLSDGGAISRLTILLGVPSLVDELCNTVSHLVVIAWLCIEIGIMFLKKMDQVDVSGAFKMMWWTVFWPMYQIKK